MRAPFVAAVFALVVAGCFTPDLTGVGCGANDVCPESYFCHAADHRCYKTPDGTVMDLAMSVGVGDGMMMMSSDMAGADMLKCNKAACGNRNCGNILDGCGGVESCGGPCMSPQTCGGGNSSTRMPNVCNSGPMCTPKTCTASVDCGLISDGCANVLDCGSCPSGKTCGTDSTCH